MAYFLVHRSEWRLVEASDQMEGLRSYERGTRMHAETECVRVGGALQAKTWDEAWKESEGILLR